MCLVCDNGYCPRHHAGVRYLLDLDPAYTDWREDEQERINTDLSRIDFESPFNA